MRRTAFLLALGLGACAGTLPILASDEARARDVVNVIATDPGRWELDRAAVLARQSEIGTLASALVDRILAEEESARAADARDDSMGRERARTQRVRCFEALIQLGNAGAAQCIREASGGGARVALALDALRRMPEGDVIPAFADALHAPTPEVRRGALRALAADPKRIAPVDDAVGALLSDGDWRVRREAAIALGRTPRPPAGDAASWKWGARLLELLRDRNLLVACDAAMALGKRQVFDWMAPLVQFLERAQKAQDPGAVFAAHAALREASAGADLSPDPAQWLSWMEQNRPIRPRAESAPGVESAPANR